MGKVTKYHKLVRDRIPELIKSRGASCITEILPDYKRQAFLLFKLHEEVDEFVKSPCLEEMADILEVVEAIQEHMGWGSYEIEKVKADKKIDRGAFTEFILLREVEERDGFDKSIGSVSKLPTPPPTRFRKEGELPTGEI